MRRPLGIGEGPLRDINVVPAQKHIGAEAEPVLLGALDRLRQRFMPRVAEARLSWQRYGNQEHIVLAVDGGVELDRAHQHTDLLRDTRHHEVGLTRLFLVEQHGGKHHLVRRVCAEERLPLRFAHGHSGE